MAKRQKSKAPKAAENEEKEALPESESEEQNPETSLATRERDSDADDADDDGADGEDDAAEAMAQDGGPAVAGDSEGTDVTDVEGEGEVAATQLGTARYVLAAFFAAGMLLAYIVGKAIHGVWATISNKDWFSRTLPSLAAVPDEEKTMYGMVIGGIVALVVVLRAYRDPEVRTWSDEVASELAKVKWPTKKDVTSSTFVVITATAVATLYLALLDRFWAFVTNLVYGDGS